MDNSEHSRINLFSRIFDMRFAVRRSVERAILLLVITCLVCLLLQYEVLNRPINKNIFWFGTRSDIRVQSRRYLESSEAADKEQYDREQYIHSNDSQSNFSTTVATSDSSDTGYNWRLYEREALAVFILSAIGSNSTSKPGYKREVKLNGWEAAKHRKASIKCCFLWTVGKFSRHTNPDKIYWKENRLPATQFTCPIRGSLVDLVGVTLEFTKKRCPTDENLYIKPFLPALQNKNTFAICVKIVYGNIDAKLLVDWMEFYNEMRVDKVFMYTYNISEPAEKILQHYAQTGFLETRQFDFPWKNDGSSKRVIGMKSPSVWQDEQVVVFDCFQRLHGYTFISILDLDEFLLPRKHSDFKSMMASLTSTYPLAAGFTFKSYIFAKDWNKTSENNGSDIVQYLRRTPALYTRQKNILIPDRIQPESIHTHEFTPKDEYKRIIVPSSTAAINHYRKCYSNYRRVCGKPMNQILDTAILQVVDKFRNRTSNLFNFVN